MSKYIEIKANKSLGVVAAGKVIKVLADDDGVPLQTFWRRRLKDAEVDNCCEIVVTVEANKSEKAKPVASKRATKKAAAKKST